MDFDELESAIQKKLQAGALNPIKYEGDSFVGSPLEDAYRVNSPCAVMRWMSDNSDHNYSTFFRLSDSLGWQGINALNKDDGSLFRKMEATLGGGEYSSPANQIYINNNAILEEASSFVNQGLSDFNVLQQSIQTRVSDGRTNPIGYGGGSLAGLSLVEAGVSRSPCRGLRWLGDNSDYTYETFTDLSDKRGVQGLLAFDGATGNLHRTIEITLGGGPNSDPNGIIYRNNTRIIWEAIMHLNELL